MNKRNRDDEIEIKKRINHINNEWHFSQQWHTKYYYVNYYKHNINKFASFSDKISECVVERNKRYDSINN